MLFSNKSHKIFPQILILSVDFLLAQSTLDVVKLTAIYKFKLHAPFKETKELCITHKCSLFLMKKLKFKTYKC